ncbi:MAG: ABC transporter permease, partial [Lachnospiraceae bacterium]|nr:ABC transporter permease [Lachnospiraceae bacterium]
ISGVYLVCYGVIGFAGASLGSVIGGLLNKSIISGILRNIGIYAVPFTQTNGYRFLVWIAVLSAVLMICFCAIFRVQGLNASHAIRRGTWQTKERDMKEPKDIHYNGRGSFELYYAVRGIWNKKTRYAYIAGVSLIIGCLTVICMGCLNAVRNIDKEPEIWGFIKDDIYVTSLEDTPVSSIIDELEKDRRVNYTYGANKVYVKYKPDNSETWQSITTEVYELPWNDEIKDKSMYGRRPQKEDEIGVGLTLAEEYGLEIGEKIELMVNGEKKEYEISGIFQTLSNYGNIIRMVTNDLDQFVKSDGKYGDYMLVLSAGTDKWEYAEELNEKYAGKFSFIASKSNGENIAGLLTPAVGTVLTILLSISVLITVNLTFLLIRREQKLIGLLKAIGMTSWQILKIYLWRNCLSALVGNSLGLILGMFIIPHLLTPYAKLLGLAEFPFANSVMGTAKSFVLLPACMFIGTCAIVKMINKISVKQLVSE